MKECACVEEQSWGVPERLSWRERSAVATNRSTAWFRANTIGTAAIPDKTGPQGRQTHTHTQNTEYGHKSENETRHVHGTYTAIP